MKLTAAARSSGWIYPAVPASLTLKKPGLLNKVGPYTNLKVIIPMAHSRPIKY
jgi:hypothetical protein